MAQPIYDIVGGFKYHSGPLTVKSFECVGTIYRGALVGSSGGKVVTLAGNAMPLGVALSYATAPNLVEVSIDPETIYECTDATSRVLQGLIGGFVQVTLENPSIAIGQQSAMKSDIGTFDTAPSILHRLQIVGYPNNVTNLVPASNRKALVKINNNFWEPYVDAI